MVLTKPRKMKKKSIFFLLKIHIAALNGPSKEGLIPFRLLSYRFGLAGLEYLNHKCVCFLP